MASPKGGLGDGDGLHLTKLLSTLSKLLVKVMDGASRLELEWQHRNNRRVEGWIVLGDFRDFVCFCWDFFHALPRCGQGSGLKL